jgi:hypothetical protein
MPTCIPLYLQNVSNITAVWPEDLPGLVSEGEAFTRWVVQQQGSAGLLNAEADALSSRFFRRGESTSCSMLGRTTASPAAGR